MSHSQSAYADAASAAPFGDAAASYSAAGATPIPVGRNKRPQIRNFLKTGEHSWRRLLAKHSQSNIGVINGVGRASLVAVDIDDESELPWVESRFPPTPVKSRTPSGGQHWWYRGTMKRCIRFEGHKVDILGRGGFQIVPPSVTDIGAYEFLCGDVGDFDGLPELHLDTQATSRRRPSDELSALFDGDGRNCTLYDKARVIATNALSREDLSRAISKLNAEFGQPLPEIEVGSIAKSVWRYKSEGRLLVSGAEAHSFLRSGELDVCQDNTDALYLLARLRQYHGAKGGQPFMLPNATARLYGWGAKRFRKARDHLIKVGLLESVQAGSQRLRKPTLVRLSVGRFDLLSNGQSEPAAKEVPGNE